MKNRWKQAGFTLIELTVVVAVLIILLAIGLNSFSGTQAKARDSKRKAALTSVTRALELYYNDHSAYPISTGNSGIGGQNWGTAFEDPDEASTIYMSVLPTDPSSASFYYTSTDGSSYQLYARLETAADPDLFVTSGEVLVYSGTDCTQGECNYGVSSTNTTPAAGHPLESEEEE